MNIVPSERYVLANTPDAAGGPGSDQFDVRAWAMVVLHRWRLILAAAAAVAGLVLVALLLQPKYYTATTAIMINPREQRVLNAEQSMTDNVATAAVVVSEIEVLVSRRLVERLVDALNLESDPNWNPRLAPSNSVSAWITRLLEDADSGQSDKRLVADRLMKSIRAKRRELSFVIDFHVRSRDPVSAARIANAAIETYLQLGFENRIESGQRASGWLADRVEELRKEVAAKESAAQAYQAKSGLLTSQGVSLTETQVAQMQADVILARSELAEREARYNQVRQLVVAGGSGDSLAGVLNSEVIRDLRQRETDLMRKQAELDNTLGDLHPSVQNNRLELANVRKQIQAEVVRFQANLRNEVEVSRARVKAMNEALDGVRGRLVQNNTALVKLNELQRDAEATRSVYESFLQRLHQVSDQGRLEASDVRVVAFAEPPRKPDSPGFIVLLVISLGVGACAGLGLVMVLEMLSDGIQNPGQISAKLGLPVIASIPAASEKLLKSLGAGRRQPADIISARPMSAYAEGFRVLKTAIDYSRHDHRDRVVAITSALPGEGKTTCSLSLGRICARAGQRTLLIDCDLRLHSLNTMLRIAPTRGLHEVLNGKAKWQDVVHADEESGLRVLPVGLASGDTEEAFTTDAMRVLLEDLRRSFNLIILDCPPVLAVAEARVIASYADDVILVARSRRTSTHTAHDALQQLMMTGSKMLGVAINFVDPNASGAGSYGHSLYYGSATRSYHSA